MKVWFTADTHFGHGNIIRYCDRPFLTEADRATRDRLGPRGDWRVCAESIREHDAALLDAINSAVGPDDHLYHLGDFAWGEPPAVADIRRRIRCKRVVLVWGNHDRRAIGPLFSETLDQGMVTVNGQKVWLNHYPMRSWDRAFHGSWHLYGHVHGRLRAEDDAQPHRLTRDVGVDACDYRPLSFEELADQMAPRVRAFEERKQAFLADSGPDPD